MTRAPAFKLLQRFALWSLFLALVGGVAATVGVVGVYVHYAPTVPEIRSLRDYQPKIGTRIYSADNQLIAEFAAERRVLVPYDKIPPLLFMAFVSAEDQRFFDHEGIDYFGMISAVLDKALAPTSKLRGASTITQQVARSLLAEEETYSSATERTFKRKLREAILARRLEAALRKEDILYIYVSQIFLGHKAYGVQAAAEHYFRKNVGDLSLAEMATLAGLTQRPSDYSPVARPEAALARRKYVLRRMLEEGFITHSEHDEAVAETLRVYPREELYVGVAPYYAEQVRRELIERVGERAMLEEGFEVYTAVYLDHQAQGQEAVTRGLKALDKRQGYRGALAQVGAERARFVLAYRQHLGLAASGTLTPVRGGRYLAVVTDVDDEAQVARLDVAGLRGMLPLAGMRWARKPDPTERVDLHFVTEVSDVLSPGDVISVAHVTREDIARDTHGSDLIAKVPKEGPLFVLDQEPTAQAALMSVDPQSGYVTAQIGGYSFATSSYNRAVQACREPGSAFKPIVYSAAIDKLGFTASTMIDDKPLVFDDPDNASRWKPDNAGEEFRGRLPLRTCVKDSINTPAIRVAEAVGIEAVLENARALGLTTVLKRELGTALGSSCTTLVDLMTVYVTLNRYGLRTPLSFIRRIVDRSGNVVWDYSVPSDPTLDIASQLDRAYAHIAVPPKRGLDEQSAFLMISLLRNVIEEGTGVAASRLGMPAAGKTGTTDDSYDAWFMGFTRHVVTGVWVGHDKKERPLGVSEQGGRTALPIWLDFMTDILRDYRSSPPKKRYDGGFPAPPGIVSVAIDRTTGLLARPNSPFAVLEYYRAGSEPTEVAPDGVVFDPRHLDSFEADAPL